MKKFSHFNHVFGVTKMTNAVEPATTTGKAWGYTGVPGKGGETLNAAIIPKKNQESSEEDLG